jgi:predicted amidohydrolase
MISGLLFQARADWVFKVATKVFKIGIIQFDVRLGDVDGNLRRVSRHMAHLAGQGVDLVLLPEMWSTGFANDRLASLAASTPEVLEQVRRLSRQMGLVTIGSLPEKTNRGIFNTAHVVDQGGAVLGRYRKVHLFSPTNEDRFFVPGRQSVVVKTTLGTIGLMICYDLRFPELCRSLVLKGAQMVAVVAQWPAIRVAHWDVLLRARAIENQVFVFGVNRCGRDGDLVYGGHSRILSPFGEVLSRAGRRAARLTASVNLSHVEKTRRQMPCLQERVPEAYA